LHRQRTIWPEEMRLPLKKVRTATMTHDYTRHGTTTLFAALDLKSGKVIRDFRVALPFRPAKDRRRVGT